MKLLISLLISMLGVGITAYLLPGVVVEGWQAALMTAILLGVVNTVIKPILVILTLPVTILTLGLFYLVINALMVLLVSNIVPGFEVGGLLSAFLFSVVLSLIGSLLNQLID